MTDERTGQGSGHAADLAAPVELVAAEVEQHDHLRVHRLGDRRNMQLVDLEDGVARPGRGGQRRHRPVGHVGPGRVVRDAPRATQQAGEQVTGGRLAIRAGDQHDATPSGEPTQSMGIKRERDATADDAALTQTHPPRHRCGRGAGADRKPVSQPAENVGHEIRV